MSSRQPFSGSIFVFLIVFKVLVYCQLYTDPVQGLGEFRNSKYNWFFTNIYAKQKTCSGRSYGRKKPRSTAWYMDVSRSFLFL